MLAAAQLGVLAACVDLFVPMGLAGIDDSNESLAPFSSGNVLDVEGAEPQLRHQLLPEIPKPPPSAVPHRLLLQSRRSDAYFQFVTRFGASDLLNGSWILIAGDSQSHLFALIIYYVCRIEGKGKFAVVLMHRFGGGVFSWRLMMVVLAPPIGFTVVAL